MPVISLIAASVLILGSGYVFAPNNFNEDYLVSCSSSKEEPPNNSTSDRSGA